MQDGLCHNRHLVVAVGAGKTVRLSVNGYRLATADPGYRFTGPVGFRAVRGANRRE